MNIFTIGHFTHVFETFLSRVRGETFPFFFLPRRGEQNRERSRRTILETTKRETLQRDRKIG